MKKYLWTFVLLPCSLFAQRIDRKALVERHSVITTKMDTLASVSVGNGSFAFTVDVTGLQTFPSYYAQGVPLGTQSEWGWHSFPNTENYTLQESLKPYPHQGRQVMYAVQRGTSTREKQAVDFVRQNPHRLQLGNLGLVLLKKDGSEAQPGDLTTIRQELNMWTGAVKSHFELEGTPVDVLTYGHQTQDAVAARIQSPLLAQNRLKVRLQFPYPTNQFVDAGANYTHANQHTSRIVKQAATTAQIEHQLDQDRYSVFLNWAGKATLQAAQPHEFLLSSTEPSLSLSCLFTTQTGTAPSFVQTQTSSSNDWKKFWTSGAAIDFSGTADPRAKELERRIILSQYLTKINCTQAMPPQETGLTYNSWYGKPHLEMHWWHGVHFALWGRTDLMEKSLDWYQKTVEKARAIAQRQGYQGVRWQKMTDPEGNETPSSVGSFLIWQQPHFIYLAELCYRNQRNPAVLKKYAELVDQTAEFMASYATKEGDRYVLGKGLIPAQECFKPEETYNPTFELAYWRWALETAQQWRERQKLSRNKEWDDVLQKLSPLPQKDDVYLATESAPDSYTNPDRMIDHPAVLGALGMMPLQVGTDSSTMHRTLDVIWEKWNWDHTWGWDFPLTALTAIRLYQPERAIEALLMPVQKNTYLPNGHNFQDGRLRIYLPGNGGLLTAAAALCAGFDGNTQTNPGLPKGWKVRWERLQKMP
ncbi:hypothetical protein BWI97_08920 [Siphonobacter sp. BAB-5405]|uniref:hypothetical protein n=1 Tax=Siphonobacter sp. BAB-5405 TaxID=1864825 RepID=UPI000C8094BF|nr:hypothetical protein [Siphonobacter sp. BAB-5405]PMD97180.1 hypothetical protein BWI97_08920 [Siphonobacter sp. BAB-5405]